MSSSFAKVRAHSFGTGALIALVAVQAAAAPSAGGTKPAPSQTPPADHGASPPSTKPPSTKPPAPTASSASKRQAEAARHFESGIKLYHDGNFEGALAEFHAAYRLKPSASSLQNIALCLKRLFRYAEAADTLEQLLDRYSSTLSADQRRVVKDAMVELNSLVGTLLFVVDPPDARVTVDGKPLSAAARKKGVRLNVGEHTVSATAPGYAPLTKVVSIAGGSGRMPYELTLTPVDGFVEVSAAESDAAIALDGKPLAFHYWRGPVAPGRHYVQVYKQGFKTFEQVVYVDVGQTSEVTATLGPPVAPSKRRRPTSTKPVEGFYGLAMVSGFGVSGAPQGMNSSLQTAKGGSIGIRAGYRLWTPIGLEMLIEGGKQTFDGAQISGCDCTRTYSLSSFRLGPDLRFMSSDPRLRFTATLGVGAVQHGVKLNAALANTRGESLPASVTAHDNESASGWGAYLLAAVGAQYNAGHILLEGDATVFVDEADTVKDAATGDTPYGKGGIIMVGLGLGIGWSEWTPDKP